MIYLFKHVPDDKDFAFKVAFDLLVNFTDPVQSFKELIDGEDIIMEASGFSFHDEYDRPVDEITVWYFEDEKKYSKNQFSQLLIMAMNKYFSLYSEGKEEINNIINLENGDVEV
jgi:hypothetical protein